jgi:hypothetical protein
MGLKCSLLGHAYEEAGVEREREEQGSEVVTVVKELERCTRCGRERVVSESTEVTTVVDPSEVEADVDAADAGGAGGAGGGTGGFGGAVERAMDEGGTGGDGAETLDDGAAPGEDAPAGGRADDSAGGPEESFDARDPEEEDAEILTDDDEDRAPGEWPDDPIDEDDGERPVDPDVAADATLDAGSGDDDADVGADAEPAPEPAADPDADHPDEESLSGITVPEGRIACPECGFEVDAESSYRDGDPCPQCNAWLVTVEE